MRGDTLGVGALISSRLLLLVLLQAFLFGFCFVAGYLVAGWSGKRDMTPLVQICAQVDYVDTMQQGLKGQQAPSKQMRDEFKALVEQCRAALRRRGESD